MKLWEITLEQLEDEISRLKRENRVECKIRDLKNPYSVRIAYEQHQLNAAKAAIKHQREYIKTLKRLGKGKRGKIKPTWQKAIDECNNKIHQYFVQCPDLPIDF